MYGPGLPVLGTFSLPRLLGVNDTPQFALIPPFCGEGGVKQKATVGTVGNAVDRGQAVAHVARVVFTCQGTAQTLAIMRPLNYSVTAAAVAANATSIPLVDDPGIYSTNYKYPSIGAPAQVADSAITTNDYIAAQLIDGTWIVRKVTGGSYAGLTVGNLPNNGIGMAKGALVYQFGIITDSNPADGQPHPTSLIAASATRDASWSDPYYGVVAAHHAGDPLLFYVSNVTAYGILEALSGFYSNR